MTEVTVTKMSSKGQIVVPQNIREMLGLKVGELFALFGEDDTIILKKIKLPSDAEFRALLKWGKIYARKKGISKGDVIKALENARVGK
ncbi:MAG: AbrB/MazE/SpoVT family DNA-binding domain-containing protein [Thermoplasmata archaeon]